MDNPLEQKAPNVTKRWTDHIGAWFAVFAASVIAQGYFGERAFGGLGIYGPYSPPPIPIDAVMATIFGITYAISLFALYCIFIGLGCELGIPEIPFAVQWPAILIQIAMNSTCTACIAATGQYFEYDQLTIILFGLFVFGPLGFATCMLTRGVGPWLAFVIVMSPSMSPSLCGTWWVWASCVLWNAPISWIAAFQLYLRDARLMWTVIFCATYLICVGGVIARYQMDGGSTVYVLKEVVALLTFTSCVLYCALLYSRFKRNFPTALRSIKCVRLGYLRQMARQGKRIARCQDMPAEAFGDKEKAQVFIITSHRWLDRYLCDMPTDDYPDGLRLGSMVHHMNEHYPVSMSCCGLWSFCSWLALSLWSQLYGGHDILLFVDFMGLPQVGKRPDGELIQRTEEETAMFMEALPSMGALYTIFPVLVLLEVTPGVHDYWASGWCSSEFVSSLLTKKLDTFSASAVEAYVQKLKEQDQEGTAHGRGSMMTLGSISQELTPRKLTPRKLTPRALTPRAPTPRTLAGDFKLDAKSAESLLQVFDADLNTKHFFVESDREIVRGIMHGYVLLRQLQDAIFAQNGQEFKRLLGMVYAKGLEKNIGHATDENLNTLLHVAVDVDSVEIVQMLLSDPNVDPNERNLRGDTPTQFFMFPRRGEAADMCRKASAHPAVYHPLPDLEKTDKALYHPLPDLQKPDKTQ